MKESFEPPNYTGLKQEIEVLRKRVEDLEFGQARSKVAGRVTRWRRLAAKPALALTAVMGAVLAPGVLSAQNEQAPLFIDPNGNVNIGSARFSKIAVNHAPQPGQKVIITGDGTDVPFNVTDKTDTVNWLTVLKDGQVLMKGGNVGVGTESVSPKLQVKGSSLLSNDTGDSWFPYYDGDSYVSGKNVIFRSNGNDERMRITKDGYVGIGTNTPGFPLTFPNSVGDKISLFGQSGANFGFGIQDSLLQIHTNTAGSDIAFGYGESNPTKFTETMRINGSGIVTIGGRLFVQGERSGTASISKNAFIGTDNKWQIKDTTKKAFTMELRDNGMLELYGTKTNGQTDWRKLATFDGANNKIEFGELVNGNPSNTDVVVEGKLWARGNIAFYWLNEGWYGLEHGSGGPLSSSRNTLPGPSDLRLKTDLHPIPSALEKVSRLRGVSFHWNEQGLKYLTSDIESTRSAGPGASDEDNRRVWQEERDRRYEELSDTRVGVIAQDVERVLPEAVSTDKSGYKSVSYYELIPLIIEAVKEEDGIRQEQARTIARQQAEIQRLTAAAQITQQQLAELSDLKQQLESLLANADKIKSVNLNSTSANEARAGAHSSRSE